MNTSWYTNMEKEMDMDVDKDMVLDMDMDSDSGHGQPEPKSFDAHPLQLTVTSPEFVPFHAVNVLLSEFDVTFSRKSLAGILHIYFHWIRWNSAKVKTNFHKNTDYRGILKKIHILIHPSQGVILCKHIYLVVPK
jgi:hypothetical protein